MHKLVLSPAHDQCWGCTPPICWGVSDTAVATWEHSTILSKHERTITTKIEFSNRFKFDEFGQHTRSHFNKQKWRWLSNEKALKGTFRPPRCSHRGRKRPTHDHKAGPRQRPVIIAPTHMRPFSLFKAHRCVVPGTVARMPMVGESFPNERSESPRKLVLLVIALVIFHIGAFVSLYAIFRLYEYSPQPEYVLVVCVLWPFALFGLLLMKSDNPKLHDF